MHRVSLDVMGYAIIAAPIGTVTVELGDAARRAFNTQSCPSCGADAQNNDAGVSQTTRG
jgi:voltage-gated potassium channel